MIFLTFLLLIFFTRKPKLKNKIIEIKLLNKLPVVANGHKNTIKPDIIIILK